MKINTISSSILKIACASSVLFASAQLHAAKADSASISEVHGSAQFFNDNVRSFGHTAIATDTQQNSVDIADGKIFVAYYNKNGNLMLGRRNKSGGEWKNITFSHKQTQANSHRSANVIVSPNDKKIHMAWGHHGGDLNYIVSKNSNATTVSNSNFKTSNFTSKKDGFNSSQEIKRLTYPRFTVAKDKNLIAIWRQGGSGKSDSFLAEYKNGRWSNKIMITRGTSGGTYRGSSDRTSYFNGIHYRGGRLHMTWTWRESAGKQNGHISNHDLMHAYSTDSGRTWKNANGRQVANSGRGSTKIDLNTNVKFKTLDFEDDVANQCGQVIDSDGRLHVVHRHNGSFYHYRWASGSGWSNGKKIPHAGGGRPKIYLGPNNSLFVVGIIGSKIQVYAASKGNNNWGTWTKSYTSSSKYLSANGKVSGDKLYLLAQRRPSNTGTGNSSRLDLVRLTLKN